MPSVQRFLSGRDNLARTAALTASSVRPSTAIERIAAQRVGGGRARLAGAYTGHEAARIDVEVIAAGGVPRASVPQFVGVGNGQLQVVTVDAAAPLQGITLTLADLGIPTESARLDVRALQLVARTPGAAGNAIRITVQPRLSRTATQYALLSAWSAGTALRDGSQWDFGGLPLSVRGELDAASPRLQFGFDPQVYRAYRVYKDGAWQFGLSPALERDVPAGTAVFAVTGGYVVTVTDGVTTETFGDTDAAQAEIVTFYELVQALQASALVEVAGVLAADRTVGGQAATDVPLRTRAWLLSLGGKVKLQNVAVPPGAPTQAVTVRCINADKVGRERWSVAGDVSGALPVATTGDAYATAAIEFAVPVIDPATVDSGEWSFKYEPTSRGETEGLPSVCVRPFRFGVNAKAKSVTFRYQKRPPADCKCSDMPTPRVSLSCLGLEGDAMALEAAYQTRLEALYEWRRDFVAGNTAMPGPTVDYRGEDIQLADRVTALFALALSEVWGSPPALVEWDAALIALSSDLAVLEGTTGADDDLPEKAMAAHTADTPSLEYINMWASRYQARMDYVRALAGIVPKSESSGSDAGSCWTDHGGTHWWADVNGYYLPAFTNEAYVSARRNTETGEAYSTQEFGFGLVVACPDRLREGDQLTINIEQVDGERPYQVGDEAVIQTIAAGPAWLAGGVDGTDVQTWRVTGTVAGALPNYTVPTDGAPAPLYSAAGVDLQLALGGIPFALGDAFSLAVEAGQFRWRQDGGAWSAPSDIPANGQALLADGITAHFDPGAAPSFVPGDAYQFLVHQPWAASHVRDAGASSWAWSGANATMVLDFGGPRPLGAIGLARYELPQGATVTVELSADGAVWSAPEVLDMTRGVSVLMLGAMPPYMRLTVANAEGGHIGWIWAGEPMLTDHHASKCQRRRHWAATRGDGFNAASLYAGVGDGWTVGWSMSDWVSSRLLDSDMVKLVAMLDWAQTTGEPLLFVPHFMHPEDASLVRFRADALEVDDVNEYQANDQRDRFISATLELDPVYALA